MTSIDCLFTSLPLVVVFVNLFCLTVTQLKVLSSQERELFVWTAKDFAVTTNVNGCIFFLCSPGYKKLDNQLSAMSQSIAHLIKCKDLNTSNSPVRGEENTNPYTEQNTILSEHNESEDKDNPEAVLDHPPREQAQDTCVVS